MTPMVSPVNKIAELSDNAWPSRHSTGRVCDEIDPRLFKGAGFSGSDISLRVLQHKSLIDQNVHKHEPEAYYFI